MFYIPKAPKKDKNPDLKSPQNDQTALHKASSLAFVSFMALGLMTGCSDGETNSDTRSQKPENENTVVTPTPIAKYSVEEHMVPSYMVEYVPITKSFHIEGQIVKGESKESVADITVKFFDQTVSTDESGFFSLSFEKKDSNIQDSNDERCFYNDECIVQISQADSEIIFGHLLTDSDMSYETFVSLDNEIQIDDVPILDIPREEHGYSNFDTTLISSQEELDTFLAEKVDDESMGWNKKEEFLAGLNGIAIDFDSESLALIRHTENSGSNQVTFAVSKANNVIDIDINTTRPEVGTDDMAYYCLAIKVKKEIDHIEVKIDGKESQKIAVESN